MNTCVTKITTIKILCGIASSGAQVLKYFTMVLWYHGKYYVVESGGGFEAGITGPENVFSAQDKDGPPPSVSDWTIL